MTILGISAFYHDSAACLVRDGRIVAAAQEERFTRKKHDAAFPVNAVAYCLREAGADLDERTAPQGTRRLQRQDLLPRASRVPRSLGLLPVALSGSSFPDRGR